MAMNANSEPSDVTDRTDLERLPCGRALDRVWADAEAGAADQHARTCPHCVDARRDLRLLGDAVRQVRTAVDQAVHPDTGTLTERVMGIVRLELRPGRTLPLGNPGEDVWIVETAAARTLRAAAESLPGVRAGSCRIVPLTPDRAGRAGRNQPSRGPVLIRIEVAVDLSWNLQHAAESIRERVGAAADHALGLPVGAIDVRVTDLLPDGLDGGEQW